MTKQEILEKLSAKQLTIEEADKLLADLETTRRGALYCKVSTKGAMSLYGLQRMPVTLYVEQWERLLAFADELRAFMKQHDAELKREMSRVLPPKHGAEYESLLDRKRSGALTSAEEKRLDALRREADVLTFRKGYAAVLLKRRGYRLPPIEELGTSN